LPSNVRDLRFAKLTPILIHEARKLRARGAQVIIALAHVGGSCTTRKAESCHGELFDTVRAIPRGLVDAVIAGHSHQCVWHRVNGILISEACAKGVAVGRIELVLHNGRVNAAESQIYPPTPVCHQVFADGTCEVGLHTGPAQGPLKDNPLLARHARVVAKIRAALTPYRRKVHAKEARVLAHLARPLRHRYRGGSEVGYLFAKMLRGAIPKADVALVNAGGIRGSLGAGPVTYKDLFGVFPFDNRVAFVDVTGAQLHSLLRASLSRTHAGILQASGLHVRVRCSDPPQVLTVTDAAGKSLNPKKIYRVVFSDFMLSGGDGLSSVLKKIPENHKHIAPNRLIREEMVRFLLHLGDKPLNTRLQPVLPPTAPSVKVVGTCSAGRSRGHTRHHPLCR
ncbi:MAG: 5'-nucleotidase C-terminal domain-containing protein, partial [Deltaproteobacteria bacterium]|nr:5'-nucleotidase C-terminal domain-containing protein [Deltaproteobacteria bacterium]